MTTLDFSNLKAAAVRQNATAWLVLDALDGSPSVELAPLSEHNPDYLNALLRDNAARRPAKKGKGGKAREGRPEDADDLIERIAETREDRLDWLARFGVRGWRGIRNAAGEEVPFSQDAARLWLQALATHAGWLFDRLAEFCRNPANFTEGAIGEADVEVLSGNSEGG